ncbi:Uncharacterized protein FWK35_00007976 [Aphis craccivora]|uniref:Uncharacterized protein n=1 Tax=Aphis craccivora TaxID=307492 RepID=A0A6G0ZAJ5_APHCR|nr:Uncharacterized protein FWK35_00007976 [Aphis craccivora]
MNVLINNFTMMCVFYFIIIFFVSVTTFWSRKSASIFKLSPVSERKVNIVGTLGESKVKNFQ